MKTHKTDRYDEEKLGQVSLWEGKKEPIKYQGTIEFDDGTKYSVTLFTPKSEHSKAIYTGSLATNEGSGWDTHAYIDFYKSKSDKIKAIGFIKWKGDQEASYRVLLFLNEKRSENPKAPKFKGFVVLNERDSKEDKPRVAFRVSSKYEF